MNIVHIEDFFHPEAGYQLNVLAKYMALKGHKVTILTSELEKIPEYLISFFGKEDIYAKDSAYMSATGVKIVRLPIIKYLSGRTIWRHNLDNVLTAVKPDIVFVHGNDTLSGIKYISKLGKLPFALISDSHMLLMASKNPLSKLFQLWYRLCITPRIKKYNLTIIRTQNDDYVERYLGIPLSQCPYIPLGSDLLLFRADAENRKSFRIQYSINEEDFVIIYAGKLDESKGGKLLAEAFLETLPVSKSIVLLVVGNAVGEYGNEIEALFGKSQNKILRFPTQTYANLPPFYQAADLAVFPKQCSLSFYDTQACGLPVIAECNNINQDRLSHQNGITFEPGSISDFRAKLADMINMNSDNYKQLSANSRRYIADNYNYSYICDKYIDYIEKEYKKQKGENYHEVY